MKVNTLIARRCLISENVFAKSLLREGANLIAAGIYINTVVEKKGDNTRGASR